MKSMFMHLFFLGILPILLLENSWAGPFGYYMTYHEADSVFANVQTKHPTLFKRFNLSLKTNENRDIYAAKLSNSPDVDNKKPMAMITAHQHASEPIGTAIIRDEIVYLTENYNTDPEAKWLVDNRQIFFVPVMNPDGSEYVRTKPDRNWRKNRRVNSDNSIGVDLNRNFPYKWGYDDKNSSGTPSAFTYRGTKPASEPETQAIMTFVNQNKIRTWQNHHCDGDVLVIPHGYDYRVKLPLQDTIAYEALCRGQQAAYGRFKKWGPSFIAYNEWALNGGSEDWGWSDSATYKVYTIITELGTGYWEADAVAKVTATKMLGADRFMIESAGFFPKIKGLTLSDQCEICNKNGIANPGETVDIKIQVYNQSVWDTTLNVRGYLSSPSTSLTYPDSIGGYGNVVELATVRNDADGFTVALAGNTPPNQKIPMRMRMTWELAGVAYEKTVLCTLSVGPATLALKNGKTLSQESFLDRASSSKHGVQFNLPLSLANNRLSESSTLQIFTSNGLVRSFDYPSSTPKYVMWDRLNQNGQRVGPGLYFAVWTSREGKTMNRFPLVD